MWLFILAAYYYYYCEDWSYSTVCNYKVTPGGPNQSMRLGNTTERGEFMYMCLERCVYHNNMTRPEHYRFIFQGYGVYNENIPTNGLYCFSNSYVKCIWNYSIRTPQATKIIQPVLKQPECSHYKKPKTALAVFYQLVFIA